MRSFSKRAIPIVLGAVGLALALRGDAVKERKLFVRAAGILELAHSLGSSTASNDSFQRIGNVGFTGPLFEPQDVVAFEENRLFIYAFGDTGRSQDSRNTPKGAANTARLSRRFIFLK